MRILVIVVVILSAGLGYWSVSREVTPVEQAEGLRDIFLQADPKLADIDPADHMAIAKRLRNVVYHRVPLQGTWTDIDWSDYEAWVVDGLFDDDRGHICGGLAATYHLALTSFGIINRNVQMFTDVRPTDSHNSTEIFVDGKWIASDATFDAFFESDGELLSYREIVASCAEDGSFSPVYGKRSPAEDKANFDTYYISLCELAGVVAIGPSSESEPKTIPSGWDGVLRYKNGKRDDILQAMSANQPWIFIPNAGDISEELSSLTD